MSQRKAMKKTLKRLREKVAKNLKICHEKNNATEGYHVSTIINDLLKSSFDTINAFIAYVETLEYSHDDYEEEWDKLETIKLEKMKKAIESIPDKSVKKKEGSKEQPFYVK